MPSRGPAMRPDTLQADDAVSLTAFSGEEVERLLQARARDQATN